LGSWKLLIDVIDVHAPIKEKVGNKMKCPLFNANLRKTIYKKRMFFQQVQEVQYTF